MRIKSLSLMFGLTLLTLSVLLPSVVWAEDPSSASCFDAYQGNKKIGGLIDYVTCITVRSIVPLIFALAFMMFLWGVVQYVMNPADEQKRTQGRTFMVWGIIALTVMFSVWGLVELVGDSFDIERTLPSFQTSG